MRWAASSPAMICSTASTASPTGSGPRARHAILQRAAGDEFHRDDRRAADFLRAEDIDAVRMIDGSREPAFAEESLARVGRIQRVAQDLERDAASAIQIIGLERRAHAALPQHADDAVMTELLAGLAAAARLRLGAGQASPSRSARALAACPMRP